MAEGMRICEPGGKDNICHDIKKDKVSPFAAVIVTHGKYVAPSDSAVCAVEMVVTDRLGPEVDSGRWEDAVIKVPPKGFVVLEEPAEDVYVLFVHLRGVEGKCA